jgi:DNA helicase-2/ATP-dependent DNA helicase PcrA
MRDVDGTIPLSHADILRRWSDVGGVLPDEVSQTSRNLIEAMCVKHSESVLLHAERVRKAVEPLISASYDDAAPRLEDLVALVNACADARRLSDVAADQVLEPPISTGDLAGPPMIDEDWLVLSTVHSAKGLEFDAVHVIHAADGNFPSDMSLGSPEGLEEERRLFYVSVTRARRHLAIYVPLRYHHHPVRDDHSWAQPSRFLSDGVRSTMREIQSTSRECAPDPATSSAVISGSDVVASHLSKLW